MRALLAGWKFRGGRPRQPYGKMPLQCDLGPGLWTSDWSRFQLLGCLSGCNRAAEALLQSSIVESHELGSFRIAINERNLISLTEPVVSIHL